MLKRKAHQNPSTLNPSTNAPAIKIISAFITRRKNPNVTTVTGMVKMTKIGFRKELRIDKTMATNKASQ